MPGKYSSTSITVTLDDGPGGTARAITSYVLEMGGVKITSLMQDVTAIGDTAKKMLPTGLVENAKVRIRGLWDTTATTGPHAVLSAPDDGPQDATRTLTVVFGDSKTATMEGYLESYEVLGKVGALTEFVAEYIPNTLVWS